MDGVEDWHFFLSTVSLDELDNFKKTFVFQKQLTFPVTKLGEKLMIPPEVHKMHGDLVELIRRSPAMDGSVESSDPQWWINALPTLERDDIENFREVIETERRSLEELLGKMERPEYYVRHHQLNEGGYFKRLL